MRYIIKLTLILNMYKWMHRCVVWTGVVGEKYGRCGERGRW